MSVVITSIELVNDLLTSLEQLIISDGSLLPFDSSPNDSPPAEPDVGTNSFIIFFHALLEAKQTLDNDVIVIHREP